MSKSFKSVENRYNNFDQYMYACRYTLVKSIELYLHEFFEKHFHAETLFELNASLTYVQTVI